MRRPRRIVVLIDCGDTLVDEGTEVKDARGATQAAELIPGAERALRKLRRRGYRLALVADGPAETFRNVLGSRGLLELFEAHAISEELGAEKPDHRMFEHALKAMGIGPEGYGRVAMVGNDLERDMAGAKRLGLTTIWVDWAPRRRKAPLGPEEVPDYRISGPAKLPALIGALERKAAHAREEGA